MGDDGSSQMGYQQHSGESMLNCPSSSMNTRPMIMNPGYCSGWDPMASLGQSSDFGASYPSDLNLSELLPKLSMFGSGNIHELVNPFVLPGGSQNPDALYPQSNVSKNGMDKIPSMYTAQGERRCQISEGRTVVVSPNGKRKRDYEPNSPVTKVAEGDLRNDQSGETLASKEQDENKQKSEQNIAANSSGKQGGKQLKDNSQDEDTSKQNYIHVRARRGQATNSHSLAERVRREKISERMRLLQELVPGCNKITGKAVMLDEIINYVQSLQQQVEFLSMKLATVNPELNFDFERLLSKDILHSRGGVQPIPGFDQGMSSTHGFPQGIHQTLSTMPNSVSQYHHMPQAVWDGDLQNLLQMGFDPNASVNGLGPNGSSKTEL